MHCWRTASCDLFFVVRRLKPMIRNTCTALLSKQVLLLHKNTCPHSVEPTNEAIRQLKFELLPHPWYSPDPAPFDYHMFGPVKEASHGWKFVSDDIVKDMVHVWLWSHLKIFFTDGISRILNHHIMCWEKGSLNWQMIHFAFVTECCTWSN